MKIKFFLFTCLLLIIFSCKDNHKLTFDTYNFTPKECNDCPKVSISFPKFETTTTVGKTINHALEEEVITLLNYDEEVAATTIEKANVAFKNDFIALNSKFPDESINWEASIEGTLSYENKNIITIALHSYIFTGGAHGYSAVRYLNFDKKKGVELENWELFKDATVFLKFVETKFRIQENIPQGQPINSTGFMFENDTFHFSENIGFTKKGLQFIYNQYEVASYADGPIILTVPYREVNAYLATGIITK